MRIVYVFPQLANIAGTERILIDKMNYLANEYGYEIYAITYEQNQAPIAYPLSEKVKHTDLDTCFWLLYKYNILKRYWLTRKLQKQLQKRFMTFLFETRPDIVVATPYHVKILEMIVRCPLPMKRVIESHLNKCYSVDKDPIIRTNLLRKLSACNRIRRIEKYISRCDLLVALNSADAEDWNTIIKTTVITNIVHLNDGAISSLNEKRVIYVGRYTMQKGIPDLLRVWELVYKRHPDWHLYLYGGMGEDYPSVYKEGERRQQNIHVNRGTTNIFDKYRESSILVLTSLYEPFGLVLPEAMSCGLPVVAFDCPYGPAKIITDGEDGYLIKNRDIKSFADCLCKLIENESLRRQIGLKARNSSQKYSPDNIMPEWKNLFESLVNS